MSDAAAGQDRDGGLARPSTGVVRHWPWSLVRGITYVVLGAAVFVFPVGAIFTFGFAAAGLALAFGGASHGGLPADERRVGPSPKPLALRGIFAAMLAASAGPAAAAQSPIGQDLTPEGGGAYVAVAGATELYVLRAAELALERARRPEVKAFAQRMLTDHRGASERLEEVTRAAGLDEHLPFAMLPMHWEWLRELEQARGSRFDRAYVEQQVEAHEVAEALHANFAANGNAARLKAHAATAVSLATRHLEDGRRLDQ